VRFNLPAYEDTKAERKDRPKKKKQIKGYATLKQKVSTGRKTKIYYSAPVEGNSRKKESPLFIISREQNWEKKSE